jgi:hypothetical protein
MVHLVLQVLQDLQEILVQLVSPVLLVHQVM